MVWDGFACSMFPYCSRGSNRGPPYRQPRGDYESGDLCQGEHDGSAASYSSGNSAITPAARGGNPGRPIRT